jgi:hypothetical protein
MPNYYANRRPIAIRVRRDRLRRRLGRLQSLVSKYRWRLERLDETLT